MPIVPNLTYFQFRTTFVDPSKHRPDGHQAHYGIRQILRRSGAHKLPQLISVLCGEMSIVGTHLFTNAPVSLFLLLDLHEAKPGLVTLQHAMAINAKLPMRL